MQAPVCEDTDSHSQLTKKTHWSLVIFAQREMLV